MAKDMGVDFKSIFSRNKTETIIESLAFPLTLEAKRFIEIKITSLYKQILTECYSHTQFMEDFNEQPLFDNSLSDEQQLGLISLLAKTMCAQKEIKLIYTKSRVVRYHKPDDKEEPVICNFNKYELTDILKMYYTFLYLVFESFNTGLNTSKSLQIKINEFRKLVPRTDGKTAMDDLNAINENIKSGKGVGLDALDQIVAFPFQTATVAEAADFINKQIAGVMRMPLSFITGEQTTGISTTGEADNTALENGLKIYFNSIFKPIVEKLMKTKCVMKTNVLKRIQAYSSIIPIIETSEYIDEDKKELYLASIFE